MSIVDDSAFRAWETQVNWLSQTLNCLDNLQAKLELRQTSESLPGPEFMDLSYQISILKEVYALVGVEFKAAQARKIQEEELVLIARHQAEIKVDQYRKIREEELELNLIALETRKAELNKS